MNAETVSAIYRSGDLPFRPRAAMSDKKATLKEQIETAEALLILYESKKSPPQPNIVAGLRSIIATLKLLLKAKSKEV